MLGSQFPGFRVLFFELEIKDKIDVVCGFKQLSLSLAAGIEGFALGFHWEGLAFLEKHME